MLRPDVPALPGLLSPADVLATARPIAAAQEPTGAIPWFPGGHTDPWDHVECAMALTAAGLTAAAERAYDWRREPQRGGGAGLWLAARDAARRRVVAVEGDPRRGHRRDGRDQPVRLRRGRCVAPPA